MKTKTLFLPLALLAIGGGLVACGGGGASSGTSGENPTSSSSEDSDPALDLQLVTWEDLPGLVEAVEVPRLLSTTTLVDVIPIAFMIAASSIRMSSISLASKKSAMAMWGKAIMASPSLVRL